MTRKDFEVVARILGKMGVTPHYIEKNKQEIDQELQKTNANYDSKRFWDAVMTASLTN